MDVEKVFHMKGGLGDASYAKNSSLQKKTAERVKHITVENMEQMYLGIKPKSLGIADLGCSSGPNTLSIVKQLVDAVQNACRVNTELPDEFRVYLNDLPTNDFNTVFRALPDLYREIKIGPKSEARPNIFIAGYPGTFYGRLFPDHCLHFVYSANSLHWLSRVPPGIYDDEGISINKKSIYITERSPGRVGEAYLKQFQKDFFLFLKSRSQEVVSGGRMVLIFLARSGPGHVDRGNSFFWELLYQSFATLVNQGLVEQEKVDSYDVHFYAPSKEEIEDEVRKEGSFRVDRADVFEMDKDFGDYPSYGVAVARAVRSVQESLIVHHFGEAIVDKLLEIYARLIDQELAKQDINFLTALLVLTKL
ncbi:S-adenosyl-L-methionine-dependentmethyltransferases superfamily protein [Striga asiatica]|uniref:S-adenosyl-L-methionine-dependentmethyltransferases superfamily protein n=1 Tax=Striga asiatica TaxID=4170 RepID=A0A5A7QQL3_STRAF|nr:S-adenosyl-L-methionine-dependentmethyltransferases superfamily protein [Striga asiatica]